MTWTRNRPLGLVYRDKAKSAGGYTLFSPVRAATPTCSTTRAASSTSGTTPRASST